MKALLMKVLAWMEHVAAFLFLAVAVVLIALLATKSLNASRARDIWSLLRGEKAAGAAEPQPGSAATDAAAKTKVEKEEGAGSEQAAKALAADKKRLIAEFDKEWQALIQFNELVKQRQSSLDGALRAFNEDKKRFDNERQTALAMAQEKNFNQAIKLYSGMGSDVIAKDFEDKLKNDKEKEKEKDMEEIVRILRKLSVRQASEILEALQSPSLRNDLMEKIKS